MLLWFYSAGGQLGLVCIENDTLDWINDKAFTRYPAVSFSTAHRLLDFRSTHHLAERSDYDFEAGSAPEEKCEQQARRLGYVFATAYALLQAIKFSTSVAPAQRASFAPYRRSFRLVMSPRGSLMVAFFLHVASLVLFVIIIRIRVFIVSHIRCGSALNKKRKWKKEPREEYNVKIRKKKGGGKGGPLLIMKQTWR